MALKRLSIRLAVVALAAAAAAYVVGVRARHGLLPAPDLYAYFYPKVLYALGCVQDGGRGLLWNPYQNCGQPFFALSQTGLLYPPYWLFLLFEPQHSLEAVLALQLAIGGIGAFLLCRELGARPLAAAAGGLAFEVGNSMVLLSTSMPSHAAPYAWVPLILYCFEHLLREPTRRNSGLLAGALTMPLLTGMPQTVFFTYQVVLLRLLFELATNRAARSMRLLGLVSVGLVLPVTLAAVQLLPEIENARLSVRNAALDAIETNPGGAWGFETLRQQLSKRMAGQPFALVPCMLSLVGLLDARTRRRAVFYAATAALYVGLAFGSSTPLYELYSLLPGATAFREPKRALWMTGVCLAPLAALGIEAIASRSAVDPSRRIAATLALTALPLLLLWWLTPNGLYAVEWMAAGLVLMVGAAATFSSAAWIAVVLLAALVFQIGFGPFASPVRLLASAPDSSLIQSAFAVLRPRLSAEDRVYLITDRGHGFTQKSASLYRVPTVLDYEPLTSRRFAEFSVALRGGRMRGLNDFNLRGPQLGKQYSRRLLDLSAARYVIAGERYRSDLDALRPPLTPIDAGENLIVYENRDALPRAYYVPRVVVVDGASALLERLAAGTDDPRQLALLESAPESEFLGENGLAHGASVRFTRDDPEHVVLTVTAPQRGFVVLSDQFLPGWWATVADRPIPIQRANYAFRLVEVPAGQSTIAFRYSPNSLWWGAGMSALAAVALAALLLAAPRRG